MQVVAAAAMEAPARGDPITLKEAKVALFRSVVDANPAHYVRGQYDGYLDIDGVAADSRTETYAALRLEIENWRWSGVPFFIRTGKRLASTATELRLIFKHSPWLGFTLAGHRPAPNELVVRLDPTTGVRLVVDAHRADISVAAPIELDMDFAAEGGDGPTPYEVLLHAAKGTSYLENADYWITSSAGTSGWIHLVGGIIGLAAGFGVFSGAAWARWLGILIATVSVVVNFTFIPFAPWWP